MRNRVFRSSRGVSTSLTHDRGRDSKFRNQRPSYVERLRELRRYPQSWGPLDLSKKFV